MAAILYDSILVFAVLYFAGLVAYPITQGDSSSSFYSLYLGVVIYVYFAWQWQYGGQTLGMKTWRIRLRATNDKPLTWWRMLVRFMVAVFSFFVLGLGFLHSLWDDNRHTWHDKASETELIMTSAEE
ncbi:hypothetical protein TPSD3_10885 [Thioflexithrix psekupsensis]|uniref:RDD domain-containing protein n=2 Tax=Thioflexithrix psekupsensis TaxID=1570016 RepID=A0A251X7I7_9GAMM|nr:hypothetical protein TPSD3_10885 [Thioflexithrix psekupsensis]